MDGSPTPWHHVGTQADGACGLQSTPDNFCVNWLETGKGTGRGCIEGNHFSSAPFPLEGIWSYGHKRLHKRLGYVGQPLPSIVLLYHVTKGERILKDRWQLHQNAQGRFTENKLIFKSLYCSTLDADINTQTPRIIMFLSFCWQHFNIQTTGFNKR